MVVKVGIREVLKGMTGKPPIQVRVRGGDAAMLRALCAVCGDTQTELVALAIRRLYYEQRELEDAGRTL